MKPGARRATSRHILPVSHQLYDEGDGRSRPLSHDVHHEGCRLFLLLLLHLLLLELDGRRALGCALVEGRDAFLGNLLSTLDGLHDIGIRAALRQDEVQDDSDDSGDDHGRVAEDLRDPLRHAGPARQPSVIAMPMPRATERPTIEALRGVRPPLETHPDSPLLAALSQAIETATGAAPQMGIFTGYTDSAVVAGLCHNKNCMSYGPGSLELAHKPDEYVPTEDLARVRAALSELLKASSMRSGC
ncbi:MAG: M20/M25/M40 family metallo-hydrolase [Coriobacteriaceae bacterium]|jgi:hypothetical protein|nr:MAG: M20/M25/M40 family metallo-hydrolase [Coriobacteriaceae bacterium]